jgi:hypothetical protein
VVSCSTRVVVDALPEESIDVAHEEFEVGHFGVSYRFEHSLASLAPRLARNCVPQLMFAAQA